jgi:ABC-type spermidine/putrescine transport system permease subunit I
MPIVLAFFVGELVPTATDTVNLLRMATSLTIQLLLTLIAAVLAMPVNIYVARRVDSWRRAPVSRVHAAVLTMALVTFIPWMPYWCLLDLDLPVQSGREHGSERPGALKRS